MFYLKWLGSAQNLSKKLTTHPIKHSPTASLTPPPSCNCSASMSSALLLAPRIQRPFRRRQKVTITCTSIRVPIALKVRPAKFSKPTKYLDGAPDTAKKG